MKIKVNGNNLTINGELLRLTPKDVLVFNCLNSAYPMAVSNEDLAKAIGTYTKNATRQRANILLNKCKVFDCIKIANHHGFGWALEKPITREGK